jgi:hypothetical protein
MKIDEVLVRRSDLSTFLVHLTRSGDDDDDTAKDRLINILTGHTIEARSPFGPAVERLRKKNLSTTSQNCVCFTETPLEHVHLMTQKIDNRSYAFEPYGIAISKKIGRKWGVNPVWYLDITEGHDWLSQPFEKLIDEAITKGKFDKSHISKLAPFIEQMGTGMGSNGTKYRKEFWWEREWRHKGNMSLAGTLIVLCPVKDIKEVREALRAVPENQQFVDPETTKFIDPRWNLEQIIGKLAGYSLGDLGGF